MVVPASAGLYLLFVLAVVELSHCPCKRRVVSEKTSVFVDLHPLSLQAQGCIPIVLRILPIVLVVPAKRRVVSCHGAGEAKAMLLSL